MKTTELEKKLENALEALEAERVNAADLASALSATELQVAELARRLRDWPEGGQERGNDASDTASVREELARQSAAAEEYRLEAADLRTMFDAMQHRIDVLQSRVAEATAGESAEDGAASATEAELRHALEDLESKLSSTRRARDQWLERLEESGREKEELEARLAASERRAAEASGTGEQELDAVRAEADRLSAELADLREQVRVAESARDDAGETVAEVRASLERAAAEKEEAQQAAATERQRSEELEALLEEADGEIAAARELLDARAAEVASAAREYADGANESAGRVENLESELEGGRERIAAMEAEVAQLQSRVGAAEVASEESTASRDAWSRRVGELESDLSSECDKVGSLEAEVSQLQSQVRAAESLLEESSAGEEASSRRVGELESDLSSACDKVGGLEAEVSQLQSQVQAAESLLEESSAGEEASSRRVGELESALASEREAVERLEGELSAFRALLEAAEVARHESSSGQDASARQVDELQAELSSGRERIAEIEGLLLEKTSLLEAVEAERDEARARLQSDHDRVEGLVAACDRAERLGQGLGDSQRELRQEFGVFAEDLVTLSSLADGLRGELAGDHRRCEEVEARLESRESNDAEIDVVRARVAELDAELCDTQEAAKEAAQEAAAEAAAVTAELREQLADVEAQRSALAGEIASERVRSSELEREVEAARTAPPVNTDADDAAQRELTALRGSFDAAVKGHADEVRSLKEDVDLQTALARDRENDMSRLSEECSILQQSVEDAISELEAVRTERQSLTDQLREIEDLEVSAQQDSVNAHGGGLRPSGEPVEPGDEEPSAVLDQEMADLAAAVLDAESDAGDATVVGRDTVAVQVEDDPLMRSAVESAVEKVKGARYASDLHSQAGADATVRLVANIAAEEFELGMFSDLAQLGLDEAEIIAYCAKDGRGVFLRSVSLFPPSCDLDECATRLLSGTDALQRLLVVGEDVDFMSGLRESLGRVRCSTAIAFDGRQVVDLIPMVKPQVVMVDLNLPRGGGLRVAAQVAADPDLRNVRLAMFWRNQVDPLVFRQQAIFSTRDFYLAPEELTRGVAQVLNSFPGRGDVVPPVVGHTVGDGALAASNLPGS